MSQESNRYKSSRNGRIAFEPPTEPFSLVVEQLLEVRELERIYILAVLEYMKLNRFHTAKALGISYRGLYMKLAQYGVHEVEEKW